MSMATIVQNSTGHPAGTPESVTGNRLNKPSWSLPFRQFPGVLRLLWNASACATIALPTLALLAGVVPVLSVYLSKLMIDGIVLWTHGQAAGRHLVVISLCAALGLRLLQQTVEAALRITEHAFLARLTCHVETAVQRQTARLDLGSLETPAVQDTLQRAGQAGSFRVLAILSALTGFGRQSITLLGFLGVLVTLSWWTIPAIGLLTLASSAPAIRYGQQQWRLTVGRTPEQRHLSYLQSLVTSPQASKELKLFGLAEHLIGRWQAGFWRLWRHDFRLLVQRSIWELVAAVVTAVGTTAFCAFVVYRAVTDHTVTVGSVVMYLGALASSMGALAGLLNQAGGFHENNLYIGQFFEYLSLQPRVCAPAAPVAIPPRVRMGIRFEQMSFRYPGSARNVLRELSFEIRSGEHVAIVGRNGSGKTTLVKLLTRLYDPQEGRILVDGIDLRNADPADWHRHIAVVFQDFARYWLTARENVGFGQLDRLDDERRLCDAADRSGAMECIRRLGHGWDTALGTAFSGGQDLSLGEWQRIALARAFLRDAEVLVLDEPTSSLDAKAEYDLLSRFSDLAAEKTTIFISHRLSAARLADRILVLDDGQLIESGSHDELMARGNAYAELFSCQASAYQ